LKKRNNKIMKISIPRINGKLSLRKLVRSYYKIQRTQTIKDEDKQEALDKIYSKFSDYTAAEIKEAAIKEIKNIEDNVYEIFCQYIVLTGEV